MNNDSVGTWSVPEVAESSEQFTITDEASANWLLGKLHAIKAEQELVTAQAAAIVARLETDRASLDRQFGSALEAWAREQIAQNRRKSIALLYGTLQTREIPRSVRVADPEAALQYALAHRKLKAQMVTKVITQVLDKKAYVALMKEDGEMLPGIEITSARSAFSIKFADGGKSDE